jgi:putative phage-type endonuclease
MVSDLCDNFFETNQNVPPRSYKTTFVTADPLHSQYIKNMKNKIEGLQKIEQPTQRTPEWYQFRHNLITASNIWKAFGSESQQNSLIYEKCKPFEYLMTENTSVNVNSPLHWGNKYERISIAIYEKIYGTKVSDFGCIQHSQYKFIGASPDGINTLETSPRYGRMVEVKNIFNREITGIPKEEYWIQMQFQMETCDLDECDFLETRFKEYESEEEFYSGELLHEHRGIILYFIKKITSESDNHGNAPHYVYMPLDIEITKDSVDEWIQATRASLKSEYSLYETQYWYLDEISVVFVKRNREWFSSCIPRVEKIWKVIEEERITGYEHRAVKKKPLVTHSTEETSQYIKHMPTTKNVCLVKLDENGEII